MITDAQTNFVYFSEHLKDKHENFYRELSGILKKHDVEHDVLYGTKDIWCRDYMPIQISPNEFVAYRYDPDYLQAKKYHNIKSCPDVICQPLKLPVTATNIILDGGNVIKMHDYIVMTDKIFHENKSYYTKNQLIECLKKLFHVKDILFIPWEKEEIFGHADGMVRLISDNKLLVNSYLIDDPFFNSFFQQIKLHKIDYEVLRLSNHTLSPDKNWAYINYLQTEALLLVPQFDLAEDRQAIEALSNFFPSYANANRIATIDASLLLQKGGGLNCISWSIKLNSCHN